MSGSQVYRLDLRGEDGPGADRRIDSLLRTAKERVLGVLLLTARAELDCHAAAYDRLLSSPQIPSLVVVLIGGLGRGRELALSGTFLEHRRTTVLWVGDPGGSLWGPHSLSVQRLSDLDDRTGLEILLSTLSTPAVYSALLGTGERIGAPALELAGKPWDLATLNAALAESLARVARPRSTDDPVSTDGKSPWGVLAASRPASVVRPDGVLSRLAGGVRTAADEVASLSMTLSRARGLFASRAVGSVAVAADDAATALERLRDAAVDIRRDIQDPGGPLREDVVRLKCERYGIDPGPSTTADPVTLSHAVADVVRTGLRSGASLAELDHELELHQEELKVGSYNEYIAAVGRACPDRLVSMLRETPAFPAPPTPLLSFGLVLGALMSWGSGPLPNFVAGAVALVVWLGVLSRWPTDRGRAVGVGGALVAVGVGLGLAASQLPLVPPGYVWLLVVPLMPTAAVVVPMLVWRHVAGRWLGSVFVREAEPSAAALLQLVESTVLSEWSGLSSRAAATDHAMSARAVVRSTRAYFEDLAAGVLGPGPAQVRTNAETLPYWRTVGDARVQEVVVATLIDEWPGLCSGGGTEIEHRVATAFRLFAEEVRSRGGDVLLSDCPQESFETVTKLDDVTAKMVVAAVGTDAGEPIRQFTEPDDIAVLSGRPEKSVVVRFAPNILPPSAVAELPPHSVLTGRSGLAGVLRVTGLREGTVG